MRDEDLVFARQIGASGVSNNALEFGSPATRPALDRPDWNAYQEKDCWAEDELAQLR